MASWEITGSNLDDLVVSYRTMGAAVALVAYVNPPLLNNLFEGVYLPQEGFSSALEIPKNIEPGLDERGRAGYLHFLANPDGWARLRDQRQLLDNLVNVTGDEAATFDMGRYVKVEKGFEKIKNLFMLFGVNPNTALKMGVKSTTRKFNRFLDIEWVAGGKDFAELRVKYHNPANVYPRGDLYTLGVLTAAIESFLPNAEVGITATISPFTGEIEQLKSDLLKKKERVSYSAADCVYQPGAGVHLYRFHWKKSSVSWREELAERLGTFLLNYALRSNPARRTARELQFLQAANILAREMERADTATIQALQAQRETLLAKSETAEARLALQEYISGVNHLFGQSRTLAHDNKNHCQAVYVEALKLLQHVLSLEEYTPFYKEALLQGRNIYRSLEQLVSDELASAAWKRAGISAREIFSRIDEMVGNDEMIMGGGTPVEMREIFCSSFLEPVINSLKKIYPSVELAVSLPERTNTYGDARLLKGAFTNLISNAVEASLPAGKVSLLVEQEQVAQIVYTIIKICQSGELSPDIADKLNRKESFTTKTHGHGIGAAASYNIITDLHHGSIEYESLGEKGEKGGRLIVRLRGEIPPQLEQPSSLVEVVDNHSLPGGIVDQQGDRCAARTVFKDSI